MACEFITKNLGLQTCAEFMGGIKAVYFGLFGDYGITVASNEVSTIGTLATVYKYEFNASTNSFSESATVNRDNLTFQVDQTLAGTVQGLSSDKQKELQLLLRSKSLAFVEDNNGNIKLMGFEFGVMGSTGTSVTGASAGDLNGYTIELKAMEREYAPLLNSTSKTALKAAVHTP